MYSCRKLHEFFSELYYEGIHQKKQRIYDIIPFNADDGYIVNFKDNHKISSKKCYVKRRPEKNLFVDKFLKNIEDLKKMKKMTT